MNEDLWPTEIRLSADRRVLNVAFEDGARFALPAEYLRVSSPSAEVQGHSPLERKVIGGKRAVAILEAEGLDPFAYGFACRDAWPAVAPQEAVAGTEAVRNADGTTIAPAVPARAACPGREAGERYGFRTDQLLLSLARGLEARLTALEAAAGP